jgi:putative glutamine amidotransferase
VRPVIGITADFDPAGGPGPGQLGDTLHFIQDELVKAASAAGGVPLLIPCLRGEGLMVAYLEAVDGLIFSGSGADLHPGHYGEEPIEALGRLNPERLDFELGLARRALGGSLPLLGICGGLQTLNVAAGGTLYQDLPSQRPEALEHKPDIPCSQPAHPVSISEGSRLAAIVGRSDLQVNSTHHQALKDVAEAFEVRAVAPDGVVEAVEAPGGRFVLAVQWHPEYMAPQCPASRAIFEAFVAAAGAHAGR